MVYLICKGTVPIFVSKQNSQECAIEEYKKSTLLRCEHEELTLYQVKENGLIDCLGFIHQT